MELEEKLKNLALNVAEYFRDYIIKNGSLNARSFYGESFILLLFESCGFVDEKLKNKLITFYKKLNKKDPEFHWEFNNYALASLYCKDKKREIIELLNPLIFKGTKCSNWALLRSAVRIMLNVDMREGIKEAKKIIGSNQLASGLIVDSQDVRSFQYHCFSIALIAEIYEITKDTFFRDSFIKGLDFIRNFILSNGDAIYIGRGQEQIFGYASLIYDLSLGIKFTKDLSLMNDLKKIYNFIMSFQGQGGLLPLVLNNRKTISTDTVNVKDEKYAGWYLYNNYFDYLPFFAVFVLKSSEILRAESKVGSKESSLKKSSYKDENFLKFSNKNYEAVISRPGGYWTNDQPMPYVVYKNQSILPCYGGEQFQKSIYSPRGLPLPYNFQFGIPLRFKKLIVTFLKDNKIILISPLGVMTRKFIFKESEITIKTVACSLISFSQLFIFKENIKQKTPFILEDSLFVVNSSSKLAFDSFQFSASGRLKLFRSEQRNNTIRIILK